MPVIPEILRRLRQENHLNPVCRGCSEPRLCHCTPAWVIRERKTLYKKKNPKNIKTKTTTTKAQSEKSRSPKCNGKTQRQ